MKVSPFLSRHWQGLLTGASAELEVAPVKENDQIKRSIGLHPLRYPVAHGWSVVLAALDLILTWVVLHLGGRELNVLADAVICRFGVAGVTTYKFGLVSFVICLCELVGRRDVEAGRKFSITVVAIATTPVLVAAAQLAAGPWATPASTGM